MRVVLVGDSTVTDDEGWGRGFRARLAPEVRCLNLARGGRSSRSYRDEGHWRHALASRATHVLIQFGHNDQPGKGPDRETEPAGGYADNLTAYVAEARRIGMRPALVTPLTRRQFDHGSGRLQDTLAPYVVVVRRIAARFGVPLIDLHAASTLHCLDIGPDGCALLSPRRADGSLDATHLNPAGARCFGGMVADLAAAADPDLRALIRPDTPAERPDTAGRVSRHGWTTT